jgi:hypothetical protein
MVPCGVPGPGYATGKPIPRFIVSSHHHERRRSG